MKLSQLINELDVKKVIGSTDLEIENIYCDSKSVTKNSVFICIKGKENDGHNFYKQVENYGAIAIVCEKELDTSITQIIVKDSRDSMSTLAAEFYGHADRDMSVIGVTGTNGKTTTTHIIYKILQESGIKSALIGTLGTFYGEKHIETELTTPDPLTLHKQFRDMKNDGVKAVVMEVSAHALYFEKLKGIKFTVGVFTNLTQDHLDFFKDMEEYKNQKIKLFTQYGCKYVVTNSDDAVGREIANLVESCISYGIENPADIFAIEIKEHVENTKFVINLFDLVYHVQNKMTGRFNVYNVLAAATACCLLGVKPDKIVHGINSMSNVSGRVEKVYQKDFSVYIDYAHTPDGLKKVLSALKEVCNGKLICVFGCGGNRDKDKRKKMGVISGKYADYTIITTDNPRCEDPLEIMMEIEKGILSVSKNYLLIQDRHDAIEYAINMASVGDIILVAGKGCEKYQEVLGIKHLYNDKDTVESIIRRNKF